jgi:hypothetical protein
MAAVRALLLLGGLVATVFLALMLATTSGHFVAEVPDLYVVCQYARAMAEGHPFRYNAGEAPTTGSTSLLHTAVLAAADAAGARGEGLVAFAVLLGALYYLASIFLAVRIGTRLAGGREGRLAGGLVALGGPVVWGYLYGSDIALFLLLALFLLDRWLAYWQSGRAGGLAVAGSLLALARPEGLPIALSLGAASLLRKGAVSRRDRVLPWVPVAAGAAVVVLQRAMTGQWLSTSVADKALLPNYGLVQGMDAALKYGVDVLRGLLLGFYPAEAPIGFAQGQAPFAFPPLGLLFVLLAAATLPASFRLPARVWLLVVTAIFALVGPNVFMGVQFNRYLLWAFPGLLAFVAVGLGAATRLLARDDDALERVLFRAGAALFLLLGALSTGRFAAVYAEMAGATWRREIPAAEWIRAHLPRGATIANVATSIEYLTGHHNLNLHGVTSPGFVGSRPVEKEADLYEALCRLPRDERPTYLLVTRSGLDNSALLPRFADGPPLYETSSLDDDLLLFRAKWDLVGRNALAYLPETRRAVAGLAEVDRLNVCDVVDERAHAYRHRSRRGELLIGGFVGIDDYHLPAGDLTVADGGRAIFGDESFRVRSRRGRPLVVVLRTLRTVQVQALRAAGGLVAKVEIPAADVAVEAGGRTVARLEIPNGPGWNEHVFAIPADAVGDGSTELRLSGRYASFQYWFYQLP